MADEVNHEYHTIEYLAHCVDPSCAHTGEVITVEGKPVKWDPYNPPKGPSRIDPDGTQHFD